MDGTIAMEGGRYNYRERKFKDCDECGHEYAYRHPKSRYCSSTCRVRAHRRKQEALKSEENAYKLAPRPIDVTPAGVTIIDDNRYAGRRNDNRREPWWRQFATSQRSPSSNTGQNSNAEAGHEAE